MNLYMRKLFLTCLVAVAYCINSSAEYRYDLAICAIFQNEAPFLKEWLEFYRLIGAQHFYLYNNLSTDNYYEVLEPYITSGMVELYDMANSTTHNNNQMDSYNDALKRAQGIVKWLAPLDLDEFLFPIDQNNLVDFLKDYEQYGGVCANWVLFGTSNVEKIPNGKLMIETLTMCDPLGKRVIKSIIRPERAIKFNHTNYPVYNNGYFHVTTDGVTFKGSFSPKVVIDKLRINHYWTRDKHYLHTIKIPRAESLYAHGFRRGYEHWYIDPKIAKNMTPREFCLAVDPYMNVQEDRSIQKYVEPLRVALQMNMKSQIRVCQDAPLFPAELQEIPFAEDSHIVLESKLLKIKDAPCAFNASITKNQDDFIIVFREDIKPLNSPRTEIRTGYAHFDNNFLQTSDTIFYKIPQPAAHDARIFYHNNAFYLLYTYLLLGETPLTHWDPYTTPMRQALAVIDKDGHIINATELNYGRELREKNWTPFEYKDSNGISHVYLMYAFNPIEVICIDEPGAIKPVVPPTIKSEALVNLWEDRWGPIRGGTQALLVDKQYLTFFHSWFRLSNNLKCYVFGALTFENRYPFRVTKISKYPIITRDFYKTVDCVCQAHKLVKKNVMFPCGVVQGKEHGRDVFYVTSGENDHAIKLITIDKEHLLQSMITVTQ